MVTLHERPQDGQQPPQPPHWTAIFDAPDLTKLLNPKGGAKAKEYEGKVNAVLKAGFTGCINGQNFPDAAAILAYGPQFAKTAGALAEADERAAKGIDILASPSNPWAMFIMASFAFGGQLWRNHDKEIAQIPSTMRERRQRRKAMRQAGAPPPAPRFTIKLGKLQIPVRFNIRPLQIISSSIQYQTQNPMALTTQIFGDPDVQKAMDKLGFKVVPKNETTQDNV